MEYYKYYRSLMYDKMYLGIRRLKSHFEEGVKEFVTFVIVQECCQRE